MVIETAVDVSNLTHVVQVGGVNKILRCVIYIRVSTDEQAKPDHVSLASQEEICMAEIRRRQSNGWLHIQTLSDPGYTGATFNRPGFIKLSAMVRAGEVDVVIVYKRDRLFREMDIASTMQKLFVARGVMVLSSKEGIYDSSPHSQWMASVIDAQSQLERANIRMRVKDALRYAAKAGKWQGGVPAFGYSYEAGTKVLTHNDHEAPIVRFIFEQIAQGMLLTELVEELRRLKFYGRARRRRFITGESSSPGESPKPNFVDAAFIRALIKNPVYRGIVRVRKNDDEREDQIAEWDEYKGLHIPIVPEELWFKANRMLAMQLPRKIKIRDKSGPSLGLLQGRLFCLCCSSAMSPGAATRKKKTGDPHRYYRCSQHVKAGQESDCTTKQISADAVESVVIGVIHSMAANPASFARLGLEKTNRKRVAELAQIRAELLDVDQRLSSKRKEIENLFSFVKKHGTAPLASDALLEGEKVRNEIAQLETDRIQVEMRLNKISAKVPAISDLSKGFGKVSRALALSSNSHKSPLLKQMIEAVVLEKVELSTQAAKSQLKSTRTFRMAIDFKTNKVMGFCDGESDEIVTPSYFGNTQVKVTFEIHSNSLAQRVRLLEHAYSFESASFKAQESAELEPAKEKIENTIQKAIRWARNIKTEGATVTGIAATENKTKGLVSLYISLLELPQVIIDSLSAGADRSLNRPISVRELKRLLEMGPADAVAWYQARLSGKPLQDVMELNA